MLYILTETDWQWDYLYDKDHIIFLSENFLRKFYNDFNLFQVKFEVFQKFENWNPLQYKPFCVVKRNIWKPFYRCWRSTKRQTIRYKNEKLLLRQQMKYWIGGRVKHGKIVDNLYSSPVSWTFTNGAKRKGSNWFTLFEL